MDFLRSILPQLLNLTVLLIVVGISYYIIMKKLPKEWADFKRPIRIGYLTLIVISLFAFSLFLFRFSAINNTPRATLDQRVKSNREQYMERSSNKIINDTIKSQK
jgi:hypothetical protein